MATHYSTENFEKLRTDAFDGMSMIESVRGREVVFKLLNFYEQLTMDMSEIIGSGQLLPKALQYSAWRFRLGRGQIKFTDEMWLEILKQRGAIRDEQKQPSPPPGAL